VPGNVSEGAPRPLGLTLTGAGANVAVYSAHASAIELCLFDGKGEAELERLRLPSRTGDVFHGYFDGVQAGQRYGFRAYGSFAPEEGHWFNPAKLLADPYALAIDRPFGFSPAMLGSLHDGGGRFTPDHTDSAPFVPKAIATAPLLARARARAKRPWAETVIYELHVRGFTKLNPRVPEAIRGTFAGLAHPAAIEHLVKLGVTCAELMPAAAWADERHLHAAGLTNYWGYNPITFMAPDPRLAPGGWAEVSASVAALQDAGIEVIVDVVFNHTGEGDQFGPTLSLRGLDNASYYRLSPGDPRVSINDTGCGNTLAVDRPAGLRLTMDSLRAWAMFGGVDGFRFDLATTLARRADGFDPGAPLLAAIEQDPLLSGLRLIAEPWDIGPGGYKIGAFPAGWGEWNDKYRDSMRKFWRGDAGLLGEAATRFSGSADVFAPRRPPSRSVNFVAAHDGFTLADLVSYEHKHNEANGESNRDGTDANYSWNNGVEGETADAVILAARRRDQRSLLAILMLARGTPMLSMGAEFGQSQGGNNNAYAQDNASAWLHWDSGDKALAAFTARLGAFRAAHPALTHGRHLTGEAFDGTGLPDVEWRAPDGHPAQSREWQEGRTLIASLYAPGAGGKAAARICIVLHAGPEPVEVTLPEARDGAVWHHCLDTAREDGDAGGIAIAGAAVVTVEARTVAVFEERVEEASRTGRGLSSGLLDKLAQAAGIRSFWYDIYGKRHIVPDGTKQALLADMGVEAASNAQAGESLALLADWESRRILPATLAAYEGEPIALRLARERCAIPSALILESEDGSREPLKLDPLAIEFGSLAALDGRRVDTAIARLPARARGRYRIFPENAPELACHLTVAPRQCYLPGPSSGERLCGIAAQLYALRRTGDQGIGDFTALGELAGMAAGAGVAAVGLNPLHALFSQDRDRASPYYPSDRRFLDPIYIDVTVLNGPAARGILSENSARAAALSALPDVDYPGVWALKRSVLQASFADFDAQPHPDEFEAFVASGGESLERFACYEAISALHRDEKWPSWPAGLRDAEPAALQAFKQENTRLVRFHLYLQWLADKQFREAAARGKGDAWLGFYRDLAVGAAPDGAEVWANADQFLAGTFVGAPPDPFAEGGQNWGLRAPNPLAWRRSGYRLFREVLSANMAGAGALRIDHAMGLTRLFVIPKGAGAADGAYLGFPEKDLIAELAYESQRTRCVIVGEDLGTVPENFRDTMDAANILSYRVMWFEREGEGFAQAEAYPRKSVACVTTHDLPTIAGWWQGEDIREKEALGLIDAMEAEAARKDRVQLKQAFLRAIGLQAGAAHDYMPPLATIAEAAHGFVRQTPSLIAIAQLDDLVGEFTAVNLPGTDRERPNWRRKLKGTVAAFASSIAAYTRAT
jgi:glycogen debranching enzyme GlgX/4-alpha-glucanotransferase